jgi:hypothetical protein
MLNILEGKIVLKKTKDTLELIMNDDFFVKNDFRFVGGTALSHIINHRLSEDLDFASLEIPVKEIEAMMNSYGAKKLEHDVTMEDYVTNDGEDIENNITYKVDDLYKKIQSITQFYKRSNDEGINTLVKNPKSYEWYRLEIEKYIHKVLLDKLYS